MIDTVQKIRDAIAARAAGKTEAQFEKERLQQGVTDAVSRWLADHPDYYADVTQKADSTPMSASVSAPITDSGMKKRCIKALGAARLVKANGVAVPVSHTADSIDPDALAIAKCRELKATDPDRYNQDIRYS